MVSGLTRVCGHHGGCGADRGAARRRTGPRNLHGEGQVAVGNVGVDREVFVVVVIDGGGHLVKVGASTADGDGVRVERAGGIGVAASAHHTEEFRLGFVVWTLMGELVLEDGTSMGDERLHDIYSQS